MELDDSTELNAENYINVYLKYYDSKSVAYKKRFLVLTVSDIILSAMIPFVVLFIDGFSAAKYIVALMGSIITIVKGLNTAFGYHKLWIEYRTVAEALKHQKDLYINNCSPYNGQNKKELLVIIVNSILENENRNWKTIELSLTKSEKS